MPFEGSLTSPAPQPSPSPSPSSSSSVSSSSSSSPSPIKQPRRKRRRLQGPDADPETALEGVETEEEEPASSPDEELRAALIRTEVDIPELIRSSRLATAIRQPRTQLATNLSPLYKLDDIYQDITSKALVLGLGAVLKHLGGRALRVATMCSGTESPLLAMELVQQNLRKHFDTTFNFRHLFSAEIVPFKQAYIERNFHPKVMFRDVTELRDRVAQTVYGSLEKIPKNADLLIAGFACVDFSNLNNNRKTLDQNGESGGTFWGIIRYARAYRPRMVILENVRSAPWDAIKEHWNEINYYSVYLGVDTKSYYLPQTRERGYLFCVDRELMKKGNFSEGHMLRWSAVFEGFQRPASSPAGMFLIDADDRRLGQIEQDVIGKTSCNPREWSRYQIRHQSYRNDQKLGDERPVSKSKDQGICQMPDFYWHGWARSLPERVWETLDINYLRKLAELEGYDMNYKERYLELSQGVDRDGDCRAFGIVGCITPSGIPYVTTRGGPICGLEALALQGLPLDRLSLSRESKRDLHGLAGNAMSSTVVGCAILAALIVGHGVLKKGEAVPTPEHTIHRDKDLSPRAEYSQVPCFVPVNPDGKMVSPSLLAQSATSARYCMCERQFATRQAILRCTLCGHTSCADCAGNPSHAYERCPGLERSSPLDFAGRLMRTLPMRLVVYGISVEAYSCFEQENPSIASRDWGEFMEAVLKTVGDELRFSNSKRSELWTVSYEGQHSTLELLIGSTGLEWLLFAMAPSSEPSLSFLREVLLHPIARMTPKPGTLLEGDWEICSPISSVPSTEARCGLKKDEFANSVVWNVKNLDVDIRGLYKLLPDCGTANGCLHKREASGSMPAVYLFLDPTKLGIARHDTFVFSLEHRRNAGYSKRHTLAEVSHKWRSRDLQDDPQTANVFYRRWYKAPAVALHIYAPDAPIDCYHLKPWTVISVENAGCIDANITLVSVTAPAAALESLWSKGPWEVADPMSSPSLMREFSWLLQKVSGISIFQTWNAVVHENQHKGGPEPCPSCVPPKPQMIWGRDGAGKVKAYEDFHGAAVYERRMKLRPPAFLIFHCVDDENVGHFHITLNVQTLLHQAYVRLLGHNVVEDVSFHWRLVPNYLDAREFAFPKFVLANNRADAETSQPPEFRFSLRPEQLRSLGWMIKQEGENVEPFIEQEIEESFIPSLMWRAEGRVTTPKVVRGGVLADEVGYGKTAIILGLIDAQHNGSPPHMSETVPEHIPTTATLIVAPQLMLQQWKSEIHKFLGNRYRVLVIHSSLALSKQTVGDFQQADIILVSWSILNSSLYFRRLQRFTGVPKIPNGPGRRFDDWFQGARDALKGQVKILTDHGTAALLDSIRLRWKRMEESEERYTYIPSQRLRGQRYADANRDKNTEEESDYADISSADDSSDASDDENPDKLRANIDRCIRLRSRTHVHSDNHIDEDAESSTESADDIAKDFLSKENDLAPDLLKIPLFHAFAFDRLVIDEFTYVNTSQLVSLQTIQARSKWALSGTPPLNDAPDVNTTASLLGVHLGADDDDERSENTRVKTIRKQRSDAEAFESFRTPRTEAWHRSRHELAQRFLDRFMRKNIAEIDEIPFVEHIVLAPQSLAERTVYLELYSQIMACSGQLRKTGRAAYGSDQAWRVDEMINSSETPEEALLKQCTSLAFQSQSDDELVEGVTCERLIQTRESHLHDLQKELRDIVQKMRPLLTVFKPKPKPVPELTALILDRDFGDVRVANEAYSLIQSAIVSAPSPEKHDNSVASPDSVATESQADFLESEPPMENETDGCPEPPASQIPTTNEDKKLGDTMETIRNLVVEWVLQKRALRFLYIARMIQDGREDLHCRGCETQPQSVAQLDILGSCGHLLCPHCMAMVAREEECAVKGCRGSGRRHNVVKALSLREIAMNQSPLSSSSKLDRLVQIVQSIPAREYTLLFIQFSELMDVASRTLDSAGIPHFVIYPTDRVSTKKVQQLQKFGSGDERVLILSLDNEMAAGLNLQCANHVVFLSPMLAQTQYDYDSAMTQAIGRSRRYGQSKTVHIYHLLAKGTVDVSIFQRRREKVLLDKDGEAVLVSQEEAMGCEAMRCEGPSLEADDLI
ncbi:putative C-5 cytosine-specific DNA methylase [Aspergillus campestris IBT 28561]|uniref:C-5 cytosine-specific DNA methylase n=1 Tax=Aspergillus campestris (strain IBT 28561) TaxID=1392248 RepID=A0A2I1CQJ3_ASPC2|nr:putative C-5 cytosine-specific DNA methylase [Aspergillus campestris IBT 28561]PKX99889.1 putative C-5 cytosine-specific DNA methylase [Aspergillus campestris IBT 28561]